VTKKDRRNRGRSSKRKENPSAVRGLRTGGDSYTKKFRRDGGKVHLNQPRSGKDLKTSNFVHEEEKGKERKGDFANHLKGYEGEEGHYVTPSPNEQDRRITA